MIPVETDFSVFEKKLEESRKETDEEKKTELLKETCALYTGELLPNMTGENWAAVANIHYRDLYSKHWKNFAPFSRRNAIMRRSTS